jgi:phosphinothricin acetyltransferase
LTPTNIRVRSALATDAEVIACIYNYYIQNTVITFEEEPVSAQTMAVRLAEVRNASLPWLVAELDGSLVGYAYANKWKVRSAYRYSVETTIYLEHGREGMGIGKRLYSELLSLLRARGMHVAIGGAALPNDASVALHEKLRLRAGRNVSPSRLQAQ